MAIRQKLIYPVILILVLLLTFAVVLAQDDDPLPLYALPDTPPNRVITSNSMALRSDGRVLVATNMLSNSVSIVEPLQRGKLAEVPVGSDPRTVTITPDDTRALVANRGDGTLSIVDIDAAEVTATYALGSLPYGVVSADNEIAYVALQGGDEIIEIAIDSGEILRRIPTPDSPAGLAIWGDFLYVTHLWSGELSLIYLPDGAVVRTIRTGEQTGLFQSLVIDPESGIAYLPQSRSNVQIPYPTFDNTILAVINRVDLNTLTLLRDERIALHIADRPVNMPFAARLDATRGRLYVVNAGSNDLSVIDLETGLALFNVPVGANPRGILLTRDNAFAYVHNAIDGSLTVIETRTMTTTNLLPISDITIPVDVLIGAELFHSAADPRLSTNNWISCASCHFDGQSDGRVWGGMNTPSLYNLLDAAPYTWSGAWEDLTGVERHIRSVQTGTGLVESVNLLTTDSQLADEAPDLDALIAYLVTLQAPQNPFTADAEIVARGEEVFMVQECASCHAGERGTDGLRYDVGTGGEFVTPPLAHLWLSAPYFHDGSAATLHDVFHLPGAHRLIVALPDDDIDALVTYLLSRP